MNKIVRRFTTPAQVQDQGDMPLDQAIYVSSIDKIIGVRGKWLYKFNATTGAKEAEARWANDVIFGESSILFVNDVLYVTTWRGCIEKYTTTPYTRPSRNLFTVNPSTLSVTGTINISGENDILYRVDFNDGYKSLCSDGTYIFGIRLPYGIFRLKIATGASSYEQITGYWGGGNPLVDLCLDTQNNVLFVPINSNGTNELDVFNSIAADGHFNNSSYMGYSNPSSSNSDPFWNGFTKDPVHNRIYGVDGQARVTVTNCATITRPYWTPTYSYLNILQPGAKPVKIKYNPYDGLIYIPTWANDTVEVLDPSTNTISAVKTGFTDPFDCVFTPTGKFAVQNSSTALKAIT